jgi:hypothetical protein
MTSDYWKKAMKIKINIIRDDDMEAFGAFWHPFSESPKVPLLIALNVEAHMQPTVGTTEQKKREIIITLMHEFGHALEYLFDLPANEEAIRNAEEAWIKKHCEEYMRGEVDSLTFTHVQKLLDTLPEKLLERLPEKFWDDVAADLAKEYAD